MTLATLSGRAEPARSLVLLTTCLGARVAQIDPSAVNLALRRICADLAVDVSRPRWVVDACNPMRACR